MNKDRIDLLKKDYTQGFPAYCGFEVLQIDEGFFEQSQGNLKRFYILYIRAIEDVLAGKRAPVEID